MSGGIKDLCQKKRNRHENTPGKKVLLYVFSDIFQITQYKELNNCLSKFCKKAENYKLICLHCQDERGRNRNAGAV